MRDHMPDETKIISAIPLQMQRLIGSSTGVRKGRDSAMGWQPVETAPFDQDIRLSVIEAGQVHALAFPCRRSAGGWLNGITHRPVAVRPTHWRPWTRGLALAAEQDD